jgi:hypothetical protein
MSIFDDISNSIKNRLKGDINDLLKSDGDLLTDKPASVPENAGAIGRKAIIDDPYFDQVHQHFIFKNKMSRITNKTLKDTSVRDWLVSSIIQNRSDTLLRFARPQQKKFDMGFKICLKDETEDLKAEDREMIANLEDFIYNCGRKDKTPPGEEMLFGEFLKLSVRDALTFGHVAVEKIKTRRGGLHRFRPLPAESIYIVNEKADKKTLEKEIDAAKASYKGKQKTVGAKLPEDEWVTNEEKIEYYKWVQMSYDNRVMTAFGDEDMIFKLFNPQNFADSMGYCYSPLEMAIINITNHMNVENYNSNFFTHGYAARGILHLKGTVTQSHLTSFRRQFYNTISGAQHAWRTPIIAGLDDVQWVGLAGSNREMEYLEFNNHVMRAICSQFQIDPIELGLDQLGGGGKSGPSTQQGTNEWKLTQSREKGLYPILMMFEDLMNSSLLPAIDPTIAERYRFKFTGFDDDTPESNVAQLQAEMTVYSSMNDLLKESGREKIEHVAADLPLNQAFWELIEKNMTRGEIRETFFKDKGASKKRELQYLPMDQAFMGWQQMLMTMDQQKKQAQQQQQQMEQEAQAQQAQAAQDQQSHDREQEQHDLMMEEARAKHAHNAANHQSLKDLAKEVGAASKPLEIGGQPVSNPLNSDLADDT